MATQQLATFSPEIPADVEHVPLIREEALDWLETHHAGDRVFTTGELLTMAGESQRRWLISRLRSHGIADEAEITIPAAADALAVLFLRSRGVKFRDAVDAVVGRKGEFEAAEPRYGGVWNRLIDIALKRIRRRLAARLLGSAAFSLIRDPERHANTLVIVKLSGGPVDTSASGAPRTVSSEDAYLIVLERPAPSCWVLSPLREVLYLDVDQLPSRAELRARHFVSVHVQTAREGYEVFLGTLDPTPISSDDETLEFVGRIFDFVFLDFQEFLQAQSAQRFETAILPGVTSSDDLQLWLITQLLTTAYPGVAVRDQRSLSIVRGGERARELRDQALGALAAGSTGNARNALGILGADRHPPRRRDGRGTVDIVDRVGRAGDALSGKHHPGRRRRGSLLGDRLADPAQFRRVSGVAVRADATRLPAPTERRGACADGAQSDHRRGRRTTTRRHSDSERVRGYRHPDRPPAGAVPDRLARSARPQGRRARTGRTACARHEAAVSPPLRPQSGPR